MRYRNLVLDTASKIDAKLRNLDHIVKTQQPVQEFTSTINEARELLENLTSMIEREERTPGEINHR